MRQVGAATLENVPDIPAGVSEAVQRYQNFRAATFQDWMADGSMLIATRFGASQQIHRVERPGADRTQLTFFSEPVTAALAISDRRLILTSDTGGDEWFQLHAMNLTGTPVRITEPGTRNLNALASDDGKRLAWSRSIRGSSDHAIFTADAANPTNTKRVFQTNGAVEPADFAADEARLLFLRNRSNRESQLMLLDLASGLATEVAPETGPGLYQQPLFGPDDRSILAISDHDSDVRRLLQIDIASGEKRALSPTMKWDVDAFALSRDGRVLAYSLNEEGFSRVVLQDLQTGRTLPSPDLPRGVVTRLAFSVDGARLAIGMSTATTPGDVWSWDLAPARLTRWTRSELGGLDAAKLVEPEPIRFESFDGLQIPALVYRPSQVAPGTRTPVVIDIHGGPEQQARPSWNPGAQYFVEVLGATVILPNVRGSDGYGKRYLSLDNAEKRGDSVRDIGALLDWIAVQPGLDPKRVAVYGQSYGGFMALAAMTHYSDRLVGGVERYGISNFISFLGNTEAYRRDNRRAEYGDERDPGMIAAFERLSPLKNVARITRPMLVMQGANDPRVPKSESDQVVAGIRRNGVDAWYVVFSDEGHGFQKKPNNDLRGEVETVFLSKLFGSTPAP